MNRDFIHMSQVARCTKIINPGTDEAKYVINVKQIAKVGGLLIACTCHAPTCQLLWPNVVAAHPSVCLQMRSLWWDWATRWRQQTLRRACVWGAASCSARLEFGSVQSTGNVQTAAQAVHWPDIATRWLQGGPHKVPDTDPAAAQDRPHGDDDDGGGEAGRDVRRHWCGHVQWFALPPCSWLLSSSSLLVGLQHVHTGQHLFREPQAGARSR